MRRLLPALLALASLTACTGPRAPASPPPLTVLAAASLSQAFTAEAAAFTRAHPGPPVRLSFAGSQALVAQVRQGVPADVLATADTASLASVAGEVTGPGRVFARNRLALLTAPGNPRRLHRLADLARPGVTVVLAGPTVPAGKAAAKALHVAGVTVHPVSLEDSVAGVVTKVRLGEADAGIGYVTDLRGARGAVAGTALPGIANSYPAGVLKSSRNPGRAGAFLDFVTGRQGQAILARYGFLPPP